MNSHLGRTQSIARRGEIITVGGGKDRQTVVECVDGFISLFSQPMIAGERMTVEMDGTIWVIDLRILDGMLKQSEKP
jgi:hypothetical protein